MFKCLFKSVLSIFFFNYIPRSGTSVVQLFVTPWTRAYQAPPFMEFSRQEYWSGLPFPSPGDLLNPRIRPRFPTLQADVLPSEPPGNPFRSGKDYFLCPIILRDYHTVF